ncbi:MAG TPA: bifunctional UDP-sugar hydrolase/5'-nucleotidase [Bacteroidales bacterium]|nr:bifunctional UDP-sugar hydrolase/5'-nucleotidase [Bacteroidales bacterium]HSA42488.1 bifunctional UDP-sugar hydrolase/5'-nucleotidase [Bacteroidales bacterium]
MRIFAFRLLLFLFFFPCLVVRAQDTAGSSRVIILHVNDMHSKIDQMARLAYLKDSLARDHPYVFLISAGDNFTGNPVVDMVKEKGYPMIDLMNRCGFDLCVFGNHEFDMGQISLQKRVEQAHFPYICCNIETAGTPLKQPDPFAVLQAGEQIRLAFLGIIQLTAAGIPDTHPLRVGGLKFTDGITKAQEYRYLKSTYGNLIGLTHLGVGGDQRLASVMPEFDLIIGGHSHTTLDTPLIVNGVMITQAGYYLKYVGKITLLVSGNRIIQRQDELIPIGNIRGERKDVKEMIAQYNDNDEFKKIVIELPQPLTGLAALGSLMTDAYRSFTACDLSFQNRGGIRIDSLAAGPLTLNDIYRLDPFGNQLVVFRLTLPEIRSLIINSYNIRKKLDLEVSGMHYTVETDEEGKAVDVMMMDANGRNLPDHTYTVALNSYIASAYTFDHADPGETRLETTDQALIGYLGANPDIPGVAPVRTAVIRKK